MGVTVAEYLKDRQACEVCAGTDDQHHCVTHMLSRPDNCLIYNAVNYNGKTKNLSDMRLLQNLRATPGAENIVLDYYLRSEPLVKKIKSVHGESTVIWDMYHSTYVEGILTSLRNGNNQQAYDQILKMVVDLESVLQ
jgi:hypothetical protein